MIQTNPHVQHRVEPRGEPTFRQLIKELTGETRSLLQQEVELAKTEMSEKASKLGRNAGYVALGGFVAFAGFLTLLGAASYGLMEILNERMSNETAIWLAPTIVGAVVCAIGFVLIQKAITTIRNETLAPRQTLETLRENKQWLQDRMT